MYFDLQKPLIQLTTKFYLRNCIILESGELSMTGFRIIYQIVNSLLLLITLIVTLATLIVVSPRASEAGVCRGSDTPTIYVEGILICISPTEKPNT